MLQGIALFFFVGMLSMMMPRIRTIHKSQRPRNSESVVSINLIIVDRISRFVTGITQCFRRGVVQNA